MSGNTLVIPEVKLADCCKFSIGDSWLTISSKDDLKLAGMVERLVTRQLELLNGHISDLFVEIVKNVLALLPLDYLQSESAYRSEHMIGELKNAEDLDIARNVLLKWLGDRFGVKLQLSSSYEVAIVHPFTKESLDIPSTIWKEIDGESHAWMSKIGLEKFFDEWDKLERHNAESFILEDRIYKGITSSIYKSRLKGKICGAKVFMVDQLSGTQVQACLHELRLMREVCATESIEGVVKYYGYHFCNTNPRRLVLFMTLAIGSLKEIAPKLSISDLFQSVLQILSGLSYLHKLYVIHRDIKCANVLVTTDDDGKLDKFFICDFGLSEKISSDLTSSSRSVGSARWMAPEVHRGEPSDWRSDIWSFGMLLVELLTGKLPYHNLIVLDVSTEIARDKLPDLPWNQYNQDAESKATFERLRTLCLSCLKLDPASRPSASSLLESCRTS